MEIWPQRWGQVLPAAVNQCRPTLRSWVIRVLLCGPGQRRWKVGGSGLPEPRTLVKGNYILIPFRNLVYIWLPGTSANCLQCLSLWLLGACVNRSLRAPCHTNTHSHRQDCWRLWLVQNTTHAVVITMQVDYSNYCVGSLVSSVWGYFPMTNTACWTGEMLPIIRLSSQFVNYSPHHLISLYLYEGPDVFQSLVFYIYQSNIRNGGCNVSVWVWVCVVCVCVT